MYRIVKKGYAWGAVIVVFKRVVMKFKLFVCIFLVSGSACEAVQKVMKRIPFSVVKLYGNKFGRISLNRVPLLEVVHKRERSFSSNVKNDSTKFSKKEKQAFCIGFAGFLALLGWYIHTSESLKIHETGLKVAFFCMLFGSGLTIVDVLRFAAAGPYYSRGMGRQIFGSVCFALLSYLWVEYHNKCLYELTAELCDEKKYA